MALTNKNAYAITSRSLKKQSAEWTVAKNENNGNVVQASRQSSITKKLLLTRFHDTMMRGDAAAIPAPAIILPFEYF